MTCCFVSYFISERDDRFSQFLPYITGPRGPEAFWECAEGPNVIFTTLADDKYKTYFEGGV